MKTDQAFARETDPFTSHEAAASIGQEQIRASQSAILRLLELFGPMPHTKMIYFYQRDHDFYSWPEQSESGIRTRCKELVRLGQIRDSGGRAVLASGRKAIVWEAVP